MEEFLIKLINTLNDIEVRGKDNLMRLFMCISEAENALTNIQAEAGEVSGE